LGSIVFLGVNWPVISELWSDNSIGLGPDFYNRVCMPPFAVLILLLALCPWLTWKSGFKTSLGLYIALGSFFIAGIGFWMMGITLPVALLGASAAVGVIISIGTLFLLNASLRKQLWAWGAYGVHLGVALIALGIAFSGPYQVNEEGILHKGEVLKVGDYELLYNDFQIKETPGMTAYEARLMVAKKGKPLGILAPQKRMYTNFDQSFAEVAIIPGLGDEVYATLLGFDEDKNISVKISINPLVNWIWIGGTLMSLAALLCFRRQRKSVTAA